MFSWSFCSHFFWGHSQKSVYIICIILICTLLVMIAIFIVKYGKWRRLFVEGGWIAYKAHDQGQDSG